MKPVGLRLRIFLTTMAVIVGLLAVTYAVMQGLVDRILAAEIADDLGRARRAHATFADVREAVLLDHARSVAQIPHLRAVLDTPDVDGTTIGYTLSTLAAALEGSLLFVADAQGTIVADTLGSEPPSAADAGLGAFPDRGSYGIREYRGRPYLVAVAPVDLGGSVLGHVGLGHPLELHVEDLHRVTGLDAAILRGERVLAASRSGPIQTAEVRARWSGLAPDLDSRFPSGDGECMATAVPLGEPGLQLVLSRPLDDVLLHFDRARRELILVGLAIAGIGIAVSRSISSRIAGPIGALTTAAKSLARGELSTVVDVRSRDEIGLLGEAFNDMARRLSAAMRQAIDEARSAQKASEAKSAFLATMSHEIRTPLNGVLGFTQQALGTDLTREQREYLETVQRSGQDLLGIIEEVLDFAKLEAGEARLEETRFHLASCLARAVDPLRPEVARKGLRLRISVEAGVPETLRGPASRVRQVVANYASNAVKFTPRGSIVVRASLAEETDADVLVRFEVEDTGIGIPADRIGRLFQPFAQLDSAASREYGGTGLGLAISKELAALMHGQVGVESTAGSGSTFWFTARLKKAPAEAPTDAVEEPAAALPRRGDAEAPGPVATEPGAEARDRRAEQRILVAEDNPINQRVTAVVLKRAGWRHALAENGEQAVLLFERKPFDLVLMDCQMPVMDGFEATRRIRELERESGRRVPIVALTANAFEADREACLAAGMDDFVAKPFDTTELVEKLDEWLARAVEARSPPL